MAKKNSNPKRDAVTTPAERRPAVRRRYYGIQEPDYGEGGGFGKHLESISGESQEGSRNPSGRTIKQPIKPPSEKGNSPPKKKPT